MVAITKTTDTPRKGDVAIFHYEKSGLKHVAVVEYVFDDNSFLISECNYHSGECGVRHLDLTYKNLRGFYELSTP